MKPLLVVLFTPAAAGAEFRPRQAWLGPFAVIVLARVLLAALLHPSVAAATVAGLPAGADEVDRAAAAAQLARELPAQLMLLPVRSFLGFAAVAALVALMTKLWRPPRPLLFAQTLALVVAAEGALLAGELVRAVLVVAAGSHSFLIPLGLDLVAAPWVSPSALPLFNIVNLFAVWYVVALAVALAALTGLARVTAVAVAVQAWGAVAFFQIMALAALRVAMHMPV